MGRKLDDLTGKQFGLLKVIDRAPDNIRKDGKRDTMWNCECQCDNKTKLIVYGGNLKRKKYATFSCGCIKEEFTPLNNYWYNIGEVINGLEVIQQTYKFGSNNWRYKAYIVKCTTCGYLYKYPKFESNLKKYGCEVCAGRKVVNGINDINTTAHWMVEYLDNKDDAYKYTTHSNKKINMHCPMCNNYHTKISPNIISRNHSLSCKTCGDGISYPEKIMMSFLNYLNIDYIHQVGKNILEWANTYLYDFYIPKNNTIIEVHGIQHYKGGFGTSYENIHKNDLNKKSLAINNNITNYIEIDCSKSTPEWISNSIINSELSCLYDLNEINWINIFDTYIDSFVLKSCELWNSNKYYTTTDIGNILHITSASVLKYLQIGVSAGICDYTKKEGLYRKGLKLKNPKNSKKVFYNGEFFDSIADFAKYINKSETTVGRWLCGKAIPRNKEDVKYLDAYFI